LFSATKFLLDMQIGVYSIWVLYTQKRLGWGSLENGLFLGGIGIASAIGQGVLIRLFVNTIKDKRSLLAALVCNVFEWVLFGLLFYSWIAYVSVAVFVPLASIGPTIVRTMLARSVSSENQGSLQGALGSLTTISRVISPIIASQAFGWVTSPAVTSFDEPWPGILIGFPCYLTCVYVIAAIIVLAFEYRKLDDLGCYHPEWSIHYGTTPKQQNDTDETKVDVGVSLKPTYVRFVDKE